MIYLLNGRLTASAESDESAAALERRGYTRCTPAEYRAQRRANDEERIAELWPENAPLMRAVGEPPDTWAGFKAKYGPKG